MLQPDSCGSHGKEPLHKGEEVGGRTQSQGTCGGIVREPGKRRKIWGT